MSDVTDFVHSSAEGRAVGAMEERAKCCGHLTGAGKLILGFSHDFGKEVIAEGVETAGQLSFCMTGIAKMSRESISLVPCLQKPSDHS